ncbi:MAG: 6-carboxytetrahydropterin synthase [Bryobacterales bacterium]|nr:6-carboxytetrahydropterin synthase [Bryobacterales bacterium]
MITVTRQYRFSASHRLHSVELSDAENQRVFGKCNNPFGHGHDYVLQVQLAGRLDADTGLVINLDSLDRFVREQVLSHIANQDLNRLGPFKTLVPTTENLALVVDDLLRRAWSAAFSPSGPCLEGVRILETKRNAFETSGVRR